jgi:hypothetical protein
MQNKTDVKTQINALSHEHAVSEMQSFRKDGPFVGIFWADDDGELIDVNKVPAESLNGSLTIQVLHKTIWQKKHHRALAKQKEGLLQDRDKIYLKDYTQVPRGRVFYKDGVFTVKVGSWINESLKAEIADEFELPELSTVFSVDSHWELGHGWSSEEDQLEL